MNETELVAPGNNIQANKVEPAQKTFFFERWDGSIISVSEREAWGIMKNRQSVVGLYVPPPKLIGVSDGKIYQKAVLEAHALHKTGRIHEDVAAVLRKGWNDELEAARGHLERPRDFDTIDKRGAPIDISLIR